MISCLLPYCHHCFLSLLSVFTHCSFSAGTVASVAVAFSCEEITKSDISRKPKTGSNYGVSDGREGGLSFYDCRTFQSFEHEGLLPYLNFSSKTTVTVKYFSFVASAKAIPVGLALPAGEIRWKKLSLEVWLHFSAVNSGLTLLKSPSSLVGGG